MRMKLPHRACEGIGFVSEAHRNLRHRRWSDVVEPNKESVSARCERRSAGHSGGYLFVAMVQTADLRDLYYPALCLARIQSGEKLRPCASVDSFVGARASNFNRSSTDLN